ncbi:uncharacterized protein LOC121417616 [Lytechinus variegatus]|uniref:uncharacterized protein LOC121417616 n=1 Tax=Lytechinus variegatus TaxID=7654 RepID=UPI001BB0D9EC|nr:uncharacterized protein LOC121417616 [Lytechinus variegatus]
MSTLATTSVIYGSMFSIGVPANGFLIWVYYKMSKKRRRAGKKGALKGFTSTDLLLLGLAVIDFIACATAPLYFGFFSIRDDWMCKFCFFMSRAACLAALFMTVALAVYRYHIVVCVNTSWSQNPCVIVVVSIMCLVLSTLMHSVILANGRFVDIVGCKPLGDIGSRGEMIYRVSVCVIFVACLVSVIALYCKIAWFLRKSRSRHIYPLESPGKELVPITNTSQIFSTVATSNNHKEPGIEPNITLFTRTLPKGRGEIATSENVERGGNSQQAGESQDRNLAASEGIPTVSGRIRDYPETMTSDVVPKIERRPVVNRLKAANRKDHGKATKMIIILTLIIYISWIPYILSLLFATQIGLFLRRINQPWVVGIMVFLIRLREVIHICNTFVYVAINNRFRKTAREIIAETTFAKCLR